MSKPVTERVTFRFLMLGCCNHLLCWVNPWLPSFCPACGKMIYPAIKGWITVTDENATLSYKA